MDYKAEFAKAQAEWDYKSEFAKAQAEWNQRASEKETETNEDEKENNAPTKEDKKKKDKKDKKKKDKKEKKKKKKSKEKEKTTHQPEEPVTTRSGVGGGDGGVAAPSAAPTTIPVSASSNNNAVSAPAPATTTTPSAVDPTIILPGNPPPQPLKPANGIAPANNTTGSVSAPSILKAPNQPEATVAPTANGTQRRAEEAPKEIPEQAPLPKKVTPTKQPSSRPAQSKSKSKSRSLHNMNSKRWPSSTVEVVIHKEQNKRIGITFGKHKGKVIVGDIDKDGLAYPTELHKGMIVLSINNQKDFLSSPKTTQQYVDQMERQHENDVDGSPMLGIVVQHPLGFIPICIPTTNANQLGLGFGSTTEEKKNKKKEPITVLTSIQPNSPADKLDTMLQEGVILKAINHKKCSPTMTTKQVFDLIYASNNNKGVVKLLIQPSNQYSRRAQTELLDTYNKPPPVLSKKRGSDSLPPNGYWVQYFYWGIGDMGVMPIKFAYKTAFGVTKQTRKKKFKSLYIVNGKAYNQRGKCVGDESKYVDL